MKYACHLVVLQIIQEHYSGGCCSSVCLVVAGSNYQHSVVLVFSSELRTLGYRVLV